MLKDDFYIIVQAHRDSALIVTPIFKIYALKLPEQSLSLHLVTCWNTHLTVGIPLPPYGYGFYVNWLNE